LPDLPLTVWVSVAQIGASVFLGLAALAVAIASAVFSYRNNFGWKPLCIVITHGAAATKRPQHLNATLRFEVWNRQKYPIALRGMGVDYPFYKLTEEQPYEWIPTGPGKLFQPLEDMLAPTTHKQFETAVTFERNQGQKSNKSHVFLTITYFDPRLNKVKGIVVRQSLLVSFARIHWWRWLSPTYCLNRWRHPGKTGDF
jgi:hypothetical protein